MEDQQAAEFTDEEQVAWVASTKLAHALGNLPTMHPADMPECVQAIHVIQNILLSRPTSRRIIAAQRNRVQGNGHIDIEDGATSTLPKHDAPSEHESDAP